MSEEHHHQMQPAIETCQRMFAKAVERRREQIERELEKLDQVETFADEAFMAMNHPLIETKDSLWTAILEEKELRSFEFEELIYRGNLNKDFENIDNALSSNIKYRMRLAKDDDDDCDEDTDFNLIEALAANTVATPAAKTKLRQIAIEYKKARSKKRKKHEFACDIEYALAERILALLLESPEFSRLVHFISENEHLLPKE
jgi:hypothetical protein